MLSRMSAGALYGDGRSFLKHSWAEELMRRPGHRSGEVQRMGAAVEQLQSAAAEALRPFAWEDGPLVAAMRAGDAILIDELNLAEDAVVERLNRHTSATWPSCRLPNGVLHSCKLQFKWFSCSRGL